MEFFCCFSWYWNHLFSPINWSLCFTSFEGHAKYPRILCIWKSFLQNIRGYFARHPYRFRFPFLSHSNLICGAFVLLDGRNGHRLHAHAWRVRSSRSSCFDWEGSYCSYAITHCKPFPCKSLFRIRSHFIRFVMVLWPIHIFIRNNLWTSDIHHQKLKGHLLYPVSTGWFQILSFIICSRLVCCQDIVKNKLHPKPALFQQFLNEVFVFPDPKEPEQVSELAPFFLNRFS